MLQSHLSSSADGHAACRVLRARRIGDRHFGGNSNWRGPVWMPVNYLLVESLYEFHRYYGDDFLVEFPVGSGQMVTLTAIADELRGGWHACFCAGRTGGGRASGGRHRHRPNPLRRPSPVQRGLSWRDRRRLGASHQTGWTGLIALLLHPRDPHNPCLLDIASLRTAA